MSVLTPSLPLAVMARKEHPQDTEQVNVRLTTALVAKIREYIENHPIRPTKTQVIEMALWEWFKSHEADSRQRSGRH